MNDDYLRKSRKTVVTQVHIVPIDPNSGLFPSHLTEKLGSLASTVWTVMVDTREGLLPVRAASICDHFLLEREAHDFASRYPIGSEVQGNIQSPNSEFLQERERFETLLECGVQGRPLNAGDEKSPLAFQILEGAGLRTSVVGVTAKVSDKLGQPKIETLKEKHGDNWRVAAVFEYCLLHLPHSSPAFLAAAYQYHYYITEDDFAAGYMWRDMECVVLGVEAEASKALETRRKAGEKGREHSVRARNQRREALLAALEAVAQRNPDIAATLGPRSLLAIALPEAANANPALWTQGQGQAEEYLGEILRGEAGENLKKRYQRLFRKKTA